MSWANGGRMRRNNGQLTQDMPVAAAGPPQQKARAVRASGDPHCEFCWPGHPCDEHHHFEVDVRKSLGLLPLGLLTREDQVPWTRYP